ncbi:hypothetical protein IWQ56_004545 [Coemansia nantahalensis]|uniref:Uncharacterized protein n=1 Tax=Coemansia nantahalensis TaxID=2789366 RepID=A0ACC1K2N1_9FUNG|nr:hypothetical protein IWQ56_004545 [Coemansia nantahalensis]KAJ2772111.1 hypothetical protein IWQ57_001905 [Coemansia nantahalensis]
MAACRVWGWWGTAVANDGSLARDQFAAERNFLSWVKLALAAAMSAAIVLSDQKLQATLARTASAYIVVLAVLVTAAAAASVWRTQGLLASQRKPLRLFLVLFVQVAGCIAAASLVFVLALGS